MNEATMSLRDKALVGVLAGFIAGLLASLLPVASPGLGWNLLVSPMLGLVFGLVFGDRVRTAGAGLIWGESFGLLWWLIGPLTLDPLLSGRGLTWTISRGQELFPLLPGQVVGYGAVLGLSCYLLLWGLGRLKPVETSASPKPIQPYLPTGQPIVPPLVQAIIVGGLGGLIGSWVFVRGIETAEFFPLVAGLMGSNSMLVGRILHYAIGTIIGVSFGVLFQRDVRGAGSGLVWGLSYGLTWWVIGPLTFLPLLLGYGINLGWSLAAARAAFSPLIAHMLYGAMVGLIYALINKLWQVLFIDSDPLNRTVEGAGARGLRGIIMGQAGGVIGGLLFTIVMVGIGALPRVASLVGGQSALAGFIVHLIISVIIGSSYGLLFEREAYSYGSGLAWGLMYGLLWWLVGALTLFPILLRQPVDWSLPAVVGFYPSLVGHLLYGAGLGLLFQILARRYDAALSGRARPGTQGTRLAVPLARQRTSGTSAPALWAVTLVLGVVIPLLLS
jgi:uncharacterized membrane protein YagU involved in acid resistance